MPSQRRTTLARWVLAALATSCLTASCREDGPQRTPPPPPAPKANCDRIAAFNDPQNVRWLPKRISGFCLDPGGSDRSFGQGAPEPLDGICGLFDGECEIYKRHGIERVVEARYLDGGGSAATINVYLSTFSSSEQAYAMFTKRTVGDGDPAITDAVRPLEAKGAAALGIGNAYLWHGKHLAELTYSDSSSDVRTLRARADEILKPLVRGLGDLLPGAPALPEAAARLPRAHRLPLGVRYLLRDALNVKGAPGGAYGYYQDGPTRWRVLAGVDDAATTHRSLGLFAKTKNAKQVTPPLGDETLAMTVDLAAPASGRISRWLVTRCGTRVFGIGDEWLAIPKRNATSVHVLKAQEKRAKLEALCQASR
ncbi:MAG: DUF6599 family protein [Polyangiaceae bacterium]